MTSAWYDTEISTSGYISPCFMAACRSFSCSMIPVHYSTPLCSERGLHSPAAPSVQKDLRTQPKGKTIIVHQWSTNPIMICDMPRLSLTVLKIFRPNRDIYLQHNCHVFMKILLLINGPLNSRENETERGQKYIALADTFPVVKTAVTLNDLLCVYSSVHTYHFFERLIINGSGYILRYNSVSSHTSSIRDAMLLRHVDEV